jgi:hypothetical protein
MTIWYNLCSFGTFFPVLVSCTKKNLATLECALRNDFKCNWHSSDFSNFLLRKKIALFFCDLDVSETFPISFPSFWTIFFLWSFVAAWQSMTSQRRLFICANTKISWIEKNGKSIFLPMGDRGFVLLYSSIYFLRERKPFFSFLCRQHFLVEM